MGIRRDLVSPQHVRWFEAEPGRLIQVRCFLGQQQLDVIGFYQHAFLQTAGMTDTILEQRRKLLSKLDKLLTSLPVRSQIVIGGDFNATLPRVNKVSGCGVLDRELTEKERTDQDCLLRVLQRHRLTALNTWGSKKQAATYVHAKGQSQIDFLCARQAVSDGEAKRARAITTNMAGWRTTGHRPLVGSIPHRWTPWKRHAKDPRVGQASSALDAGQMLRGLQENMDSVPVKALRDAVEAAGGAVPEKVARPEMAPVTSAIKDSWRLRRRMQVAQTLLGAGFVFVFRYFRIRIAYLKAHRLLKKALRNRKRQRTLQLLQQAEQAAGRHDIRGMYGVVNLLCPKKGSQKIRLRDDAGNLMNGEAECQALATYAQNLFAAPEYPRQALLKIPCSELRIERWFQAAKKIKAEKAAPHLTPPLRNWKQSSDLVVPVLHNIAVRHLRNDDPQIPTEWTEVQLAWLAKPNKCPSSPGNLRTVGLMAGDTKIFMSVLKEAVMEQISEGLWDIPQFAYRKMSSTIDALLRGSLHCAEVRSAAGEVNTDVTTRLTTGALPEITGGLMVSLDLAKAFDCMPFGVMYESLREVGVSDAMARLVVETHRQSTCIVRHCGHSVRVSMKYEEGLTAGMPVGAERLHGMDHMALQKAGGWVVQSARELVCR